MHTHRLSGQGQRQISRQKDIWADPLMNKNKTQALSSAWRLISFRRREGRQAKKKERRVNIEEGEG